jgi:carboxyl-terminal processing protease
MIVRTVTVALAGLLLATTSVRAAEPANYAALFDEVWKTVDARFYDPTFGGRDWNAIGARHRKRLGEVRDDAGFSRLVAGMLGELKVSHLYLSQPAANAAKGGVSIGATLETVGDDQVVVEVAPLSDAQRQGLRVGDRIANPGALRGPLGQPTTLQVIGCDGARRTLTVRHEQASWPPRHPGFEWRKVGVRPGVKLGYIRIDRFDDGAAKLADQAMDELADTQGLVIDVRANTGGNMSGLRLASYFSGESRPAVALLGKAYLTKLGRAATAADLAKLPPVRGAYTDESVFAAVKAGEGAAVFHSDDLGPKRYKGKVVVVTSGETASAGEGFALMMRDLAGARLIGRPTAGYLLSSDVVTLTGGWRLTVPVDGVWAPDGRDYADKPVAPDVALPRTAADVCRADDPDLTRAVELVTAP